MEFMTNKNPNDKNWSRIWRDFWITLGTIIGINIIGITAIFFHKIDDKFTPILWALACAATGGVIGFLFGIPRVLQDNNSSIVMSKNNDKNNNTSDTAKSSYRIQVNTNLEQISDWLTKIIIGVGLIEIRRLPEYLNSLSSFLAEGVDGSRQTQVMASTIIIYFTMVGFLGLYLMTRIYLSQAFSRADWGTQNTVTVGGQELTLEEFSEQQRIQLADLQEHVIKAQPKELDTSPFGVGAKRATINKKTKVNSILWVDDNPKNNSLHIQRLNELGIQVAISLSTSEAIKQLESKNFDRIISDMGRLEDGVYNEAAGLDLLNAVVERNLKTPVLIYCAGKLVKKYRERAIKEGATIITSSGVELIKALQVES